MRIALLILLLSALPPAAALGQPAATAASLAGRLESGDTIFVLDTMSREVRGVFGELTGSGITLMVDGKIRELPFSEVRRVTRYGGDPLWNGVLIGAAVGGLSGAAFGGAAPAVGGAVFYGGIGALVDMVRKGRVVVYDTPRPSVTVTPLVGPGRRGVRVSVGF